MRIKSGTFQGRSSLYIRKFKETDLKGMSNVNKVFNTLLYQFKDLQGLEFSFLNSRTFKHIQVLLQTRYKLCTSLSLRRNIMSFNECLA